MLDTPEASVLDVLDHVLTKGVMATGDVTLGVAGVDLIYLRLSALLCATDRVMPPPRAGGAGRGGEEAVEDTSPGDAETALTLAPLGPCRAGYGRRAACSSDASSSAGSKPTPPAAPRSRSRGRPQRPPARWNPEPEDVQKSVAQLVLTVVEFLRKLMERQAIRRMEEKTLTDRRSGGGRSRADAARTNRAGDRPAASD